MLQGQESWSASLAKRTCSLVLGGYRLIKVWWPPVQRCQCWAAWAHGWWWWFSWSHQPDLDHRRGQDTWSWHSSLLVRNKISCFFILWHLPGARFTVCSSDIPLSYKHPSKQADGGGQHLTGWGQLEAGSNWLVGCNDPSHCARLEQCHLIWAYNSKLLPPVLVLMLWTAALKSAQAWTVYIIEILGCTVVRNPLSASLM